jgi:Methyltransferase domain
MKRIVESEWLDELPVTDPAALGSRRDLVRLNRLMGHADTLCELLKTAPPPRRIAELGAGSGELMLQIAGQLHIEWPDVQVTLVDRQNAVTRDTLAEFGALGWPVEIAESDVFDWLAKAGTVSDLMIANLFLHHFNESELSRLLELAAEKTKIFVACEPRRAAMPLAFSRMVGFVGCNAVTRHDAPVSVRAGFARQELSGLWPANNGTHWRLRERRAHLFTHTFLAQRGNGAST